MSTSSTASTAALSALLSALDNGSSGIDVTTTVDEILEAESAPEQQWETQQSTLSSQTSAIQQIESDASSLTDSLNALNDPDGTFGTLSATSSNTGAVSATATTGAEAGSHTVVVNNLASTSSYYSNSVTSSSTALGAGSFSITEGGKSTTFRTGTGTTGDDLTDLATAINSAGIGVTASVITDSSGSRLDIVSNTSGSSGSISISTGPSLGGGLTFTQATAGTNASLTVDGVPVSSSSNTVTGAITGVTLDLTGDGTSTVTIAPDASSITSALQTFVSDYNTVIGDLNTQFTFSTSTNSEGVLGSDSVVRDMQDDVLSAANLKVGSGTYTTLTSLGITTNDDGTLSLNTTTLDTALSTNYQAVVNFFQGTGSTAGFATSLTNTLNDYTDPSGGAFTTDLQSISNENTDLQNQIDNFQAYLSEQQTLLTTEYNNANIALQQLPETIKQTQALLGGDSSSSS